MMNRPEPITKEEIFGIISADPSGGSREEQEGLLTSRFAARSIDAAVLGVDVLGYSQMSEPAQSLLPLAFSDLIEAARSSMIAHETWLFHSTPAVDLESAFVPTGDGGFQVLETPLHGLILAAFLKLEIDSFNVGLSGAPLRQILGPIRVRFSLAFGSVFSFEGSFYGAPIITAARLMSRDKLDRFLVEERAFSWFEENCGGLETLSVATLADLRALPRFVVGPPPGVADKSVLFGDHRRLPTSRGIRLVIALRLGGIKIKQRDFAVYNTMVQVALKRRKDSSAAGSQPMVVSVGNLHSADLAAGA